MSYLRAAKRFWWVVFIGLAAACLTGLVLLYKVDRFVPPHLEKRAKTTYAATTELLVDSNTDPYLRVATSTKPTNPPRIQSPRSATKTKTTTKTTPATAPLTTDTSVADTQTLIDAANLFPLLVKSDAVTSIRRGLVGELPGTVDAKAIYASQGLNRFRPSKIPVIQISAVSRRPKSAIALAEGTANAFELWLRQKQVGAKIPRDQRIVLRELHAARHATAQGGPSYSLLALASLGVLALFFALAILLDQRLPRAARESRPEPVNEGHGEGVVGGFAASSTTAEPQP